MTLFDGKLNDQKVKEMFEIDEEILEEVSSISSYWSNSYKFYGQVKDKLFSDMTPKQVHWLESIDSYYEEEYRKYNK